MTDDTERELRLLLHQRAEQVPADPEPPVDQSLARGRRIRTRRRAMAAAAASGLVAATVAGVAVFANTVIGEGPEQGSSVNQPSKPSTTSPSTDGPSPPSTPSGPPNVDRCADVPADEPPLNHGVDTVFNPETLLLGIGYSVNGENRHITIDYANDPSCADHARLRKIIDGVIGDERELDPDIPLPPWGADGG